MGREEKSQRRKGPRRKGREEVSAKKWARRSVAIPYFCSLCIGGTELHSNVNALKRGVHIVVGTPGRLCQLVKMNRLNVETVRVFVVDEADKMMDDSYKPHVNWLFSQLAHSKQVCVFSATYPGSLDSLLSQYMQSPTLVKLDSADVQLVGIKQYLCLVDLCENFGDPKEKFDVAYDAKFKQLVKILHSISYDQALVFCGYQRIAESLAQDLKTAEFSVDLMAGNLEQSKRNEVMSRLKRCKNRLLVTTDLTSRGIDAQNVNLVICFETPSEPETYFHRIGRAGRYGTHGAAITVAVNNLDAKRFFAIGANATGAGERGFNVKMLASDVENVPHDLCTNVEYWEAQKPVIFPNHKKEQNFRPRKPIIKDGRLHPLQYLEQFGLKEVEISNSEEKFVYSREEFVKLNPECKNGSEGQRTEINGCFYSLASRTEIAPQPSVFDPIDMDIFGTEGVGGVETMFAPKENYVPVMRNHMTVTQGTQDVECDIIDDFSLEEELEFDLEEQIVDVDEELSEDTSTESSSIETNGPAEIFYSRAAAADIKAAQLQEVEVITDLVEEDDVYDDIEIEFADLLPYKTQTANPILTYSREKFLECLSDPRCLSRIEVPPNLEFLLRAWPSVSRDLQRFLHKNVSQKPLLTYSREQMLLSQIPRDNGINSDNSRNLAMPPELGGTCENIERSLKKERAKPILEPILEPILHRYSREQLMEILQEVQSSDWEVYVDSNYDTRELPFVRDRVLRCSVENQMKIIQTRRQEKMKQIELKKWRQCKKGSFSYYISLPTKPAEKKLNLAWLEQPSTSSAHKNCPKSNSSVLPRMAREEWDAMLMEGTRFLDDLKVQVQDELASLIYVPKPWQDQEDKERLKKVEETKREEEYIGGVENSKDGGGNGKEKGKVRVQYDRDTMLSVWSALVQSTAHKPVTQWLSGVQHMQQLGIFVDRRFEANTVNRGYCPSMVVRGVDGSSGDMTWNDVMQSAVLYAVPKHKTSRQKKETRRYGALNLYKPKRQLLLCNDCGNYHDHKTICDVCFESQSSENKEIKKLLVEEWKNGEFGKLVQQYKNDKMKSSGLNDLNKNVKDN